MKRIAILVTLLGLLLSVFTGCQPQFQAGTYTDDMGRAVDIKVKPQKIVSHVPSITETLFALDLGEKVAGVCNYCDYPEAAKAKPSVGNYFNPSIENIVALNPDLVLTDGHSDSIKQLDSLGINYLVIQPKDIEGIFRDIELLGKATGAEAPAKKLVSQMKRDMSSITDRAKGAAKVRVMYLIDATDLNNPWTTGPGSFIDALITMAGGENIAARATAPWIQLSIEQIVSSDPEIIILPAKYGITSLQALKEHPVWQKVTAVKQNRVYTIDADLLNRPGPRIIQGLAELAKIIHPEIFK